MNLKFKNLKILSDQEKKAVQFKFGERFNIIVGKTNSVGKTSLVKSLFWALGCEPYFDGSWKTLDCKVFVEFSVGNINYKIARHGDRMFVAEGKQPFQKYPKITGEYSKKFAGIVGFNMVLPVRDKEEVTTPPPAYYCLPFYIDQKQSWANAWAGFDYLGQFARWQQELIPYHVGITKKEYFTLTEEIYSTKKARKVIADEIGRFDTALSVVTEFVPKVETTFDINEFESIKSELRIDVAELHNKQEVLFGRLANLHAEYEYLNSQYQIAAEAVKELESDYNFALANDDEIECPTCGVIHDNSLVSRFSILKDKDQAEQVAARLGKALNSVKRDIRIYTDELSDVKLKIQKLNDKYCREENSVSLENILDSIAAHSVKHKVEEHRKEKVLKLYDLEEHENNLSIERTNSAKEMRTTVIDKFQELYPSFTAKLNAFGVNSSAIKSPMNYRKVANSGGAAEGTRAMLAYYLAIYNLVNLYSEEVLGPLVIDTPRQHEQAAKHYESIVKLVLENTPTDSQIFLCGMESEQLKPLKDQGKTFELSKEHSLLDAAHYKEIKEEIGWIFQE